MKKWSRLLVLLIALEAISVAVYLGKAGQFGFPLDDAWIHQTYARNLGLHGVMAFSPNQPSTGSTSPGWTMILALGYILHIPFFIWTYALGCILTIATAFTAARLSERYFGNRDRAFLVAVICMLEWHLAWMGLSGMETILFILLILLFFLLSERGMSPLLLGALTGIIVTVRPEGILLAIVYGSSLLRVQPRDLKRLLRHASVFFLAFALTIGPWIAFNLAYGGKPFPNTISAKFMQYGHPWSPFKSLKYMWDVLIYFVNGPLILLVPCAGWTVYNLIRTKNSLPLRPMAWSLTLIGLYAAMLPVIYDHGRYLMPLIPFVVIYGVEGLHQFLARFIHAFLSRLAVWFALFGVLLSLWINGASDYAFRVQLYGTVHLQAAQWINSNAPPDAILATHDIGLIGYHTGRQVVDLAGLVTPEIVPLMNDQRKLAEYVRAQNVRYVIVYSGYFRVLLAELDARPVFSPHAEELRELRIEPFEVYEIGG
jgi:arabinofuranosyltransferase